MKNSILYEITAIFAPSRNLYQCKMDTGWRLTNTGSLLGSYNISYFSNCLPYKYCRDEIAHAPSKKTNLFYVDIKNGNFLNTKWSKLFLLFFPIPWLLPPLLQILRYKCRVQQLCYYIQGAVGWGLGSSGCTWKTKSAHMEDSAALDQVAYSLLCEISTFRSVQRSGRQRYGRRSSGHNPVWVRSLARWPPEDTFSQIFCDSEPCRSPTVAATMPAWFVSVPTQSLKVTRCLILSPGLRQRAGSKRDHAWKMLRKFMDS